MNFRDIQEAIRVAVRDACGLSDLNTSGRPQNAVVWKGTKEAGGMRPALRVDLRLRNPTSLGQDETRYVYDSGTDENVPSICGIRMLPVEVRIESDTQAPGDSESVGGVAGRLRTRLGRVSVLAALQAAGVAVNDVQATTDQEYTRDGRVISVSITEVLFSAAENDTDDTAGAGDYIAHAGVKSNEITKQDGTATAVQMDETIPPIV